ncbi:MAG TPA: two-component sensor histidine kinase, partial [Sphingobium sp.]
MTMPLASIPPLPMQQDGPSLSELMTALPVATLVVRPDNRIADANMSAETLLNMARSAIVGSDVTRTIRMAEMGARFDIWHSNKPIA